MSDLCARNGISRRTGDEWLDRFVVGSRRLLLLQLSDASKRSRFKQATPASLSPVRISASANIRIGAYEQQRNLRQPSHDLTASMLLQ